jgi:hypothetical protein
MMRAEARHIELYYINYVKDEMGFMVSCSFLRAGDFNPKVMAILM